MGGRLFAWLQRLLPQHGCRAWSAGWQRSSSPRQEFPDPRLHAAVQGGHARSRRARADRLPDLQCLLHAGAGARGARLPEDPAALACPVDGTVSECAPLEDGTLLQAKGFRYELTRLLGGETPDALLRGSFATIYLAPYDYHRIHAAGRCALVEMRYLPGALFSVNGATVGAVPRLFARNERVACLFETDFGPMAVVLVGALNVGSIATTWAGQVAPGPDRQASTWRYPARAPARCGWRAARNWALQHGLDGDRGAARGRAAFAAEIAAARGRHVAACGQLLAR
jgi:phosphatidylserine decarboxylase